MDYILGKDKGRIRRGFLKNLREKGGLLVKSTEGKPAVLPEPSN